MPRSPDKDPEGCPSGAAPGENPGPDSGTAGPVDLLDQVLRSGIDGDHEGVDALFAALDQPSLTSADAAEWCWVLLECGHPDLARRLIHRIDAGDELDLLQQVLEGEERGADEITSSRPADERAGPDVDPLLDTTFLEPLLQRSVPDVADEFLRWFGGRRDLYARQWYDEKRRRSGYHPVQEPLTPHVATRHLAGRMTVGQYLLHPDSTASFGVLDLDLPASVMADLRTTHGEDARALLHPPLGAYARRLLDGARRLGVPLWPEDSGGKGLHLWVFLQPRRPARAVRTLLGLILTQSGAQPADVNVEVFPKQDRPGQKGLSSLVKLPLGLHQVTLRPCPLLDDELRPIEDPAGALARLRTVPDELVSGLLGRQVIPLPPPELEPGEGPPPLPRRDTARSLAEALRELGTGPEAERACERMIEGCAILRGLLRRGYESRRLGSAQARALVYTLGLIPGGQRLVGDVLATTQSSRRELDRVGRSLPSPTGCKRLRDLEPELARDCRCPAGRDVLPYPTPALLAVSTLPPSPPTWKPFAPWLDDPSLETADPLETIGEWLRRIEERLRKIEEKGDKA